MASGFGTLPNTGASPSLFTYALLGAASAVSGFVMVLLGRKKAEVPSITGEWRR